MASFSNFFSKDNPRTTFFLCWSLCRLSSSLRCLQSSSLSPLRKAAISPIHNVSNLLYTLSRPLFPGLVQEKAEPEGDVKANGVVVRVFGAVLPLPDSHIPQMHTFFSQNLNQQIQFTSHVNKVLLEPRVLPFTWLAPRGYYKCTLCTQPPTKAHLTPMPPDININAQKQSQTYTLY